MSDGTIVALHKGKGNYKSLAFDDAGAQLAFLSDQAEYDKEVSPYRLYYWKAGDAAATELVSATTRGMPQGMVVSDQAAPRFSDDGTRLYRRHRASSRAASTRRRGGAARRRHLALAGSAAAADAARARAAGAQPHLSRRRAPRRQAVRAAGDAGFSERRSGRRFRARHRHVRARRIAREMSWDTTYNDVALVDLKSGQRQPMLQHWRGTPTMSPGGRYLLYFDETEADWFTYRDLRRRQGQPDREAEPELLARGSRLAEPAAGLRRGRLDDEGRVGPALRQVRHLGDQARRHAARACSPPATAARIRSSTAIDRSIPKSAPIPTDKPMLLSANDDKTESSGFYRVSYAGNAAPEKIVMVDKSFGAADQGEERRPSSSSRKRGSTSSRTSGSATRASAT